MNAIASAPAVTMRSVARQRAGEGMSSWRKKVKKLRSQLMPEPASEVVTV
jgi:hypothetical protein